MGDVGERPAMDEGRVVLQRLHEIGRERVLEQRRHRARGREVPGGDGFLVAGLADLDLAEPTLKIGEVAGQAEDRHDFRRHGDIEAGFARITVGGAAQRGDDVAQRPVVHIDGAPPGDTAGVDVELVAPIDMIVDQRREQIVGGTDGVEVAGEMQVDVLHGHDLRVAAAGGATLHPEAGPKRWLANADDGLLADLVQRIAKPDRGRGLALAGRRGGDGGDEDEFAVGPAPQRGDIVERDFRLVMPVGDQVLGVDAELVLGHFEDRPHLRGLADLDIRLGLLVLLVRTPARFFGSFTRLY